MHLKDFFGRCKYLYLLFDDSFLVDRNYVFTTEGHPLPVLSSWHDRLPEAYIPSNWTFLPVLLLLISLCFMIHLDILSMSLGEEGTK